MRMPLNSGARGDYRQLRCVAEIAQNLAFPWRAEDYEWNCMLVHVVLHDGCRLAFAPARGVLVVTGEKLEAARWASGRWSIVPPRPHAQYQRGIAQIAQPHSRADAGSTSDGSLVHLHGVEPTQLWSCHECRGRLGKMWLAEQQD